MSRRTRIYVSGPIKQGDWKANHMALELAGHALRAAGYAPFVPSVGEGTPDGELSHAEWMECDMPYVDIADCMVRLPGPSEGADEEAAAAKEIGIPVYISVQQVFDNEPPRRYGDDRFHRLLQSLGRLHDRKQQDYGTATDPFANVRASQEYGVSPWLGGLIRMNDKVTRLKNFATKRKLANESFKDSLLDLAVYAIITFILYEEEN